MINSFSTILSTIKYQMPKIDFSLIIKINYIGLPTPTLYIPVITGDFANYISGTADTTGITLFNNPTTETGYISSSSTGGKKFTAVQGTPGIDMSASQYARLPNYTMSAGQSFTTAFWFKINANSNVDFANLWCISSAQYPTTPKYTFAIFHKLDVNKIYFQYARDGGAGSIRQNSIAVSTVSLGTWTHLAAVYTTSNDGITLYINNVVATGGTTINVGASGNLGWTSVSHFIAKSSYTGDPYCNVTIDDFRFYNGTALNTTQLTTLYNNRTPGYSIVN